MVGICFAIFCRNFMIFKIWLDGASKASKIATEAIDRRSPRCRSRSLRHGKVEINPEPRPNMVCIWKSLKKLFELMAYNVCLFWRENSKFWKNCRFKRNEYDFVVKILMRYFYWLHAYVGHNMKGSVIQTVEIAFWRFGT